MPFSPLGRLQRLHPNFLLAIFLVLWLAIAALPPVSRCEEEPGNYTISSSYGNDILLDYNLALRAGFIPSFIERASHPPEKPETNNDANTEDSEKTDLLVKQCNKVDVTYSGPRSYPGRNVPENTVSEGIARLACPELGDAFLRINGSADAAINASAVRGLVKEMFFHGFQGYLDYAFPCEDLAPLSCTGAARQEIPFITLIDALDALSVLNEPNVFSDTLNLVLAIQNFAFDKYVSVFETNIRILGGLVSAVYQVERMLPETEQRKQKIKKLITLAVDLADRLLPAFNTPTKLPYGSVNLVSGVRYNETSIVCTACVGSLILEFGMVTRLTNDPKYYNAAYDALDAVWRSRTSLNLVGNHICAIKGVWVQHVNSIASHVDSYYEYLWKGYVLFNDPRLLYMFEVMYNAVERHLPRGDYWHAQVDARTGHYVQSIFGSLQAFWPGLQVSFGHLSRAAHTLHRYAQLLFDFPLLAELIHVPPQSPPLVYAPGYPLRPELVESTFYLYHAIQDPGLRELGLDIIKRIIRFTLTPCGFSSIDTVYSMRRGDHMESFFLAETLKYMYLLFEETDSEFVKGSWVFSTEAHLFPISSEPTVKLNDTFYPDVSSLEDDDSCYLNSFNARTCGYNEFMHVKTKYSLAPPNKGFDWISPDKFGVCPAPQK